MNAFILWYKKVIALRHKYLIFTISATESGTLPIMYIFVLLRFMWFMIKVTFGEHDRCNATQKPETRFVLRAFTGDFSFMNFDNDIALLRLNDRVPVTQDIRPICLPTNVEGKIQCTLFFIIHLQIGQPHFVYQSWNLCTILQFIELIIRQGKINSRKP